MTPPARTNLLALVVVAMFFAAVAPTLPMLEFANGAEGLNVATALEIRRTGNWMLPTLQGEARLAKPPLVAWITAASISQRTLRDVRSADPIVRDGAFRRLAWEVRAPALLAACVTLLATFAMMRALTDSQDAPLVALVALAAAGSMLLTLRFCRYATTDVYLAMFVAIANACLARAIFQSRWWTGCMGAGAALGLALLTKGPVALVFTLVPAAVVAPFVARAGNARWAAIVAGCVVMLVICAPWFVEVMVREPRAWRVWLTETSRIDATDSKGSAWYNYFAILPYAAPWSVFLVAGLLGASRALLTRESARLVFASAMLVMPLLIMSFFKDRAERYMLPVMPAAACVGAIALTDLPRAPRALRVAAQFLHWAMLLAIAAGFPVALSYVENWYRPQTGLAASIAFAVVIAICIVVQRRRQVLVIAGTTFLVMLAAQAMFIAGYRNTREGRAELRPLAETIATAFPDAEIFNAHPDGKRPPPELGVYLARTITWIADPSKSPRGAAPKVVLYIQRRGDPEPAAPHGWEFVAKFPRDKDQWWAFALQ